MMCPNCKNNEFITSPNRYDILSFQNGKLQIVRSETLDEEQIFCRECGLEVDISNAKIKLKK
ncbi:hypothetical protein CVU5213_03005 [Campylobacter vulpis]|uniref:Uncharacterized protein n=1 Tax=Campylobacter vulpis TaxID=1655500 RepID=A0A2G4R250_9BACT|nr:hypothetical protein [Campylobacter vulpis]MBS4235278.1 hypothetical protein [Campylobacter vulpis]MBS4240706.1 hypothetical protein [Campylobacter vulpis]MBS4252262.1 hypothetical protein [Campylobacter vulpis]MBS4281889.1 hypothetical protein [Campylobacter vulpis]MBS4313205.1 hypothetical protein [Campylobacter vulpis]